jgi:GNAT superfamily N-acetyltransferase
MRANGSFGRMDIRIRAACAGDVPAMHRIRCRVRENRLSDPAKVTEASYRPYVEAGNAWVAEAGTGVVGFAALDLASATVWALFVAPEAEGMGVGHALQDVMLDRARQEKVKRLSLLTERGSRAETFYLRTGWERVPRCDQEDVRLERRVGP